MIVFLMLSFFIFLWKALKKGAGSLNGIKLRYEREANEKTRQAINQGAALLSHSIKNQIYKIDLSLQTINFKELDSSSKNSIEIINRSSKHLMEIIERMHSKTQEIEIIKSKSDLNRLIDESLENLKLDLHKKNIKVEKLYSSEENIVYCDRTQTYEMFINILKNSIEAVDDGGQIKVAVSPKNSINIMVSFSDNGMGIPSENLKYVTDPFFSTKKKSHLNYGMGLNHCNEVMYKSGGDLKIESKVNEGTSIMLIFPVHLQKGDIYEELDSHRAN